MDFSWPIAESSERRHPVNMLYRVSANLVLVAHFVFVAFAVFGGVLVFYDPGWMWLHIPVVLWSSVVNLMSWTCPLTPAENYFRNRAGIDKLSGGFIQHYLGNVIYPGGMPRQLELVAGVSILAGNMLVYAIIFALSAR